MLEKNKEAIVEYGKLIYERKLTPGTSGNLSIRDPETGLVAISPSGVPYFEMRPEDVVIVDLEGNVVEGALAPSSEKDLHLSFYRHRPDANAVVHTHSIYSTIFAVLHKPIQAVHYVIGDYQTSEIPVAEYRLFGTAELAKSAMEAVGQSNAVLLENHGVVICGKSMPQAMTYLENLEYLAELQYRAMSIGTPYVLDGRQMEDVLERFKTYGQPKKEEK